MRKQFLRRSVEYSGSWYECHRILCLFFVLFLYFQSWTLRPALPTVTSHQQQATKVAIQLAQFRFPGLAISNAKILFHLSNKIIPKQFCQTALGNWWFEIPKCWLQFKKKISLSFSIIFGALSFPIAATCTMSAIYGRTPWAQAFFEQKRTSQVRCAESHNKNC